MDTPAPGSYVSVRLNPVGRALTFLLNEADPPAPGAPVVVRTEQGPAVGTVVADGGRARARAAPA